jgi:hypothetical protein
MVTVRRVENQPDLGQLRRDLTPPGIRSLIVRRYPRYLRDKERSEKITNVANRSAAHAHSGACTVPEGCSGMQTVSVAPHRYASIHGI